MSITAEVLEAVPTAGDRRDPLAVLAAQDVNRVPTLVPVRYERMAATPFTFYRGAAAVMAGDLAATPDSGIVTQLCGDAHLSNFGLFLSPARRLVFDLNDFDETHPGPFEWDVKRLAASLVVAAQGNGATDKEARTVARRAAWAYRKTMRASAAASAMTCWYAHVDAEDVMRDLGDRLDSRANARTQKVLDKARHRNSAQALSKLGERGPDGRMHLRSDPPLLVRADQIFARAEWDVVAQIFADRFAAYRETLPLHVAVLFDQYEFVEAARKVVGVGSVGTRCWIHLLAGKENGDPLFLQMKEATESVLAPFVAPLEYANQGRRVVYGQQLLQASSDVMLGWLSAPIFTSGEDGTAVDTAGMSDFYLRQLRDGKGSVVIEGMPIDRLTIYGELCGSVLAQAHARTSARGDIARLLADLGKSFDQAIARWALAYSALNVADHAGLTAAIAAGEVQAATLSQ